MAMHVVYHKYYIHRWPQLFWKAAGGGGGGVCGQDRARGRHLTAANALPAFGRFDQFGGGGGGGGGAVRFRLIQPVEGGGGGCCPLLADSTSGWEGGRVLFAFSQFSQWGGGGGGALVC